MAHETNFYIEGRPHLDTPYHYATAGLSDIYLLNGVELRNDADYGEVTHIEDRADLQYAIGMSIVENPEPMTGEEFQFLRNQMMLTHSELACHMRVSEQTIVEYETGNTVLAVADPHMRILYLLHTSTPDSRVGHLKTFVRDLAERKRPTKARRKMSKIWKATGRVVAPNAAAAEGCPASSDNEREDENDPRTH
jgi:DNA-binding transcriptional regulator YiaG